MTALDPTHRPSETITALRAEIDDLEAYCDLLKGALAAQGVETIPARGQWAKGLTRQQRALVGILFAAYPRAVPHYDLLDAIPGRDHVEERQLQVVKVLVSHVRARLGKAAIENLRGEGYRLGPATYDAIVAGAEPAGAAEPGVS